MVAFGETLAPLLKLCCEAGLIFCGREANVVTLGLAGLSGGLTLREPAALKSLLKPFW